MIAISIKAPSRTKKIPGPMRRFLVWENKICSAVHKYFATHQDKIFTGMILNYLFIICIQSIFTVKKRYDVKLKIIHILIT